MCLWVRGALTVFPACWIRRWPFAQQRAVVALATAGCYEKLPGERAVQAVSVVGDRERGDCRIRENRWGT